MYKTRKKSVIFPFILGHSSFVINATNFYILETGFFFFFKSYALRVYFNRVP